jgi:hypothetical protein
MLMPVTIKRGTIEARTRKPVVDIFLDQFVAGGRDLLPECEYLALDGAFLRP